MNFKHTFLIMTVIVFYGFTVHAQLNTRNMLIRGQNAIYYDDYITAIDNFNNIIATKPFLSEPYFFRGVAKMNLDDNDGAIADYDKAIDLNPNYFLAYMYRGISYNNQKKYDRALTDFNSAIKIDPSNPYVYANRGITKASVSDYKGAEKDYSKALLLDNRLEAAYLNRALMRERLENKDGAMSDCNAVLQLNIFSDDAYSLRGYLWYTKKDYHNAIEDFNQALKINPKNERVLMNRAIVWYEMKKYPEALADYTEVIKLNNQSIYAYYNRALLRAEIGDYNNAIADLDEVVEMNPNNILIFFNRGLLKIDIGDLIGAYNDFSESIRIYPDFVKAYMARSSVSAEMGNYSEAEKDREQANSIMQRYRKMKAGDKNALLDTTENFSRLVDFNSKNDKIRDVINGRIQDKNVIVSLQDIFYVQFMNIDSLRKGKVKYYNSQIMAYNQKYNYRYSFALSNRQSVSPDTTLFESFNALSAPDINFMRGVYYLEKQNYMKAISEFDTVRSLQEDNILAIFNEANSRMLMYEYIESINNGMTSILVGGEKSKEKVLTDYSNVLSDYYRCLDMDPTFVFALFNIANVYVKNEQIEQAIETYTKVINIDESIAEAYYNRGILNIYIGKKSEAGRDLSKAGEKGITDAYNLIKRYCN
ncbi:MAG: tetratricopeptide repeat protein [Culturomica sp.]|nr:tetratricopeptide repeat protein [Culturomica sp.]